MLSIVFEARGMVDLGKLRMDSRIRYKGKKAPGSLNLERSPLGQS